MGLRCSHDAFKDGYSDFNRLRQAVCRTLDGSYPPHYKYDEDGKILKSSGLVLFDEEKDINNFYLPNELETLVLPNIEKYDIIICDDINWSCKNMLIKFIKGCREAHKEKRSLLFR